MTTASKFIVSLAVAALTFVSVASAEVVLIANPSVQEDALPSRDVKDIFLGARSRLAAGPVTPVLLREGATHDEFLTTQIGRSPVQFQTHWRNIVFTGKGKALASFESESAVVDYVKSTSGAIGYVSAATPTDGVKVVKVE